MSDFALSPSVLAAQVAALAGAKAAATNSVAKEDQHSRREELMLWILHLEMMLTRLEDPDRAYG